MRRHHARDPRRGERAERHQLDARKPLAVVLDARQIEMAVDAGVAVAREVLGAGGDAFPLQSEREGDRVARDLVRIPREAAIADHRVRRVGVDVGDRGEVEIHAQVGELAPQRAGQFVGVGRRAALAKPSSSAATRSRARAGAARGRPPGRWPP